MRTLILIVFIGAFVSCNKSKKNTTIVNGTVINAVTGEPMNDIEVRLIEDISGFPFTAATTVETTRTDLNGNFYFERKTKEALGVAISPNNEYISTDVVYDAIKTYETNIELGKVNNITLTPAEYGFLRADYYGDSGSDSILYRSFHMNLIPNNYNPNFWTFYEGDVYNEAVIDKITGSYIMEYYKYNNGIETHHLDTVEIFEGQTTNYELHF